jgi:hypothetical protein
VRDAPEEVPAEQLFGDLGAGRRRRMSSFVREAIGFITTNYAFTCFCAGLT